MHTDFQKMLEISFLIHKNPGDVDFQFLLEWCSVSISVYQPTNKTQESPLVFLTIELLTPTHKWNKGDFLNHDAKL